MRLMLALLLVLFGSAVLSKITVYSPPDLKQDLESKEIDYIITRYGNIPYGQALTGTVYLADPETACGPINLFNSENEIVDPSVIVFAEIGNCRSVTKARYAQMAGAKVLILLSNSAKLEEHRHRDYGNNNDINIPIIIIGRKVGEKIRDSLKAKEKVQLMIHFPKESPSEIANKVDVDFWFTSSDITNSAYSFINSFKPIYDQLKDYINFKPHPVLWLCGRCRLQNWENKESNCLSGGRYCSPDPDNSGPRKGSQVVLEDLRQLCIWRDFPDQWWSYVENFGTCKDEQELCDEKSMEKTGFDDDAREQIDDCIDSSFVSVGNKPIDKEINENNVLKYERSYQVDNNIQHFPSLAINHVLFSSRLQNLNQITESICEGLSEKPSVCANLSYLDEESLGAHSAKIAVIISLMVIAMCVLLYVARRAARRDLASEMPEKINEAIAEYFALKDTSRSDDV